MTNLNPTAETLNTCNHFNMNIWSDLYKDVYGSRPHGQNLSIYSAEELDTMWNNLRETLSENIKEEKARKLQAENDFTDRLYAVMNKYDISSARALAWLGIRKESFYGWSETIYDYGLSQDFQDQLDILAAE